MTVFIGECFAFKKCKILSITAFTFEFECVSTLRVSLLKSVLLKLNSFEILEIAKYKVI